MLVSQATAKGTQMIDEDGLLALIKAAPDPNAGKENVPEPMDVDDDLQVIDSGSAPAQNRAAALKSEFNKAPSSSRKPVMPARPIGEHHL